jgi:hypothetical protein
MIRGKASNGLATVRGRTDSRGNRKIESRIDEGLRAMHDEIVKQGVPDRFVELLAKYDQERDPRREYGKK